MDLFFTRCYETVVNCGCWWWMISSCYATKWWNGCVSSQNFSICKSHKIVPGIWILAVSLWVSNISYSLRSSCGETYAIWSSTWLTAISRLTWPASGLSSSFVSKRKLLGINGEGFYRPQPTASRHWGSSKHLPEPEKNYLLISSFLDLPMDSQGKGMSSPLMPALQC